MGTGCIYFSMGKDPAFLFYDGDAAKDVSHMNRLERGCYFDLIQAQRKFHGITVEQARKILGNDFDACWGSLELILTNDNGVYCIEWLRDSIKKRADYAEIQRKRITDHWNKVKYRGNSTDIPLEDEDEDVIENNINIEFDSFWNLYDHKVGGRKKPEKKWNNLKDEERQKIMDSLPAWKLKYAKDKKFQPHPLTYLNNERWNDEISDGKKDVKMYQGRWYPADQMMNVGGIWFPKSGVQPL